MAIQKMSREARNSYRKANNIRRNAERREAAEKRNADWAALPDSEKIKALLSRPGYSEKQLRRLGFIVE